MTTAVLIHWKVKSRSDAEVSLRAFLSIQERPSMLRVNYEE
jgi:hypothetical protein